MQNKIAGLIVAAILFSASSAFGGNYLTGKLGIYLPDESRFLDNGFNIEGVYGLDITSVKNLALELGLGYYTADDFRIELSVIPVTATLVYTFALDGPVNFYGGLGLGLYFSELEFWSDRWRRHTRSETNLGLQLLGGIRYALNKQMDLVGELKLVEAGDINGFDAGGAFLNSGFKYNF
jgi:opacity protein-like surface antigen